MTAVFSILGALLGIRDSIISNLLTEDRLKMMLEGLGVTLEISLFSLFFATLGGALLCALRMSRNRALQGTARFYIELMRSLPLLLPASGAVLSGAGIVRPGQDPDCHRVLHPLFRRVYQRNLPFRHRGRGERAMGSRRRAGHEPGPGVP